MKRLYTIRINRRVYNTTNRSEAWRFIRIMKVCEMTHEPYYGNDMDRICFINEQ